MGGKCVAGGPGGPGGRMGFGPMLAIVVRRRRALLRTMREGRGEDGRAAGGTGHNQHVRRGARTLDDNALPHCCRLPRLWAQAPTAMHREAAAGGGAFGGPAAAPGLHGAGPGQLGRHVHQRRRAPAQDQRRGGSGPGRELRRPGGARAAAAPQRMALSGFTRRGVVPRHPRRHAPRGPRRGVRYPGGTRGDAGPERRRRDRQSGEVVHVAEQILRLLRRTLRGERQSHGVRHDSSVGALPLPWQHVRLLLGGDGVLGVLQWQLGPRPSDPCFFGYQAKPRQRRKRFGVH
mmetsp:Transcript_36608/g.110626  ORF Transcript_36608/g.110626 Transcript_36608/m.110626 type:complete len:290 (+) Transcript_36608:591-1460(+)